MKDIIDKKSDCELVSASGFYGYGTNTEKIKKILALVPDLFTNETYNFRNEFWVYEILNLKIERVGGYVKECIIENNRYVQYFIKKIREIYN